ERKLYYNEEWSKKDLSDFIVDHMEQREFGFDRDGRGPNDRYNKIETSEKLEWYLKHFHPYASYSSISFYEKPEKREGWLSAELVFDIDAKDLPMRRCNCEAGNVCETCLEDAKEFVFLIEDTLRGDLGVKKIKYVYSGRGYHMRIFDEDLMHLGSAERGYILDYVSGGVVPEERLLRVRGGYPRVFRERMLKFLEFAGEAKLKEIPSIGKGKARAVYEARRTIANELEEGSLKTLKLILKEESFNRFMEHLRALNAGMLDGKVTVDVKRILRLPSSLHSTVSMKCTEIKDLESFDPLRDAVPGFVGERRDG
ncbi:MAG: DNA primase catalytic subunit PriS, partial [Candidatus Hydrothermarchaeaceae archaeon]